MTPDQAAAFVISQCEPDSGTGEPQTFLGGLRPYRGLLPRACFHGLMSALRTLAPRLARREPIEHQLVSALWTLCHLTRMWALVDGSMLRRNNLIDAADLATLEQWNDMFSYAVMTLLDSGDEKEAFFEYERYRAKGAVSLDGS
jgi:hypothetical protein